MTIAEQIAALPGDVAVPARRRPDLIAASTGNARRARWTVKDPLSLAYFQLHAAEHFVWQQLDGRTSLLEIQDRFFRQFSPQRLERGQILSFVLQLVDQGLVLLDLPGQSGLVLERETKRRARDRQGAWLNMLAIRFRGIDPDRGLTAALPWVRWLFSPWALALSSLFMLIALTLVAGAWDQLARELPRFRQLFRADRLAGLALTIGAVKVLHELGHACACKRLGGECRELGFMLLAGTPCLYCNVSDAWLLPRRWQRVAVSAAGIYVELTLAALCAVLWRWTEPGMLHSLCLAVMILCSVNTLLLNGNPLLRYDGYYILSDLAGEPNLRSRSQALARDWLQRLAWGAPTDAGPERGLRKAWLIAYGLASGVYGWVVLIGILWVLYQAAARRDLQMLIVVLGAVILSTRMLAGITSILRSAAAHSRRGRLSPRRAIAAGVVGPAALLALLLWPWPRHARAPAVIRGGDARPAFVSLPGRIHAAAGVEYGCIVQQGQVLATLVNRELEQSVAELRGEVALQRRKVELLETRLVSSPQAAAQLPAAQAALAALVERLRGREGELDRLTLRAPAAGLLLPPDSPDAGSAAERRMALGGPLSADKDGAWLEAGLAVAVVADPRRREATAYVDQAEAALIAPGTSARVCAEQSAGGVQTGSVSDVSMRPALEIPLALALRGDVPIQPAAGGRVIPARPLHEVRVRLAETSPPLAVGQPARVRISLGRESLWAKLCRWAQLTLKLD